VDLWLKVYVGALFRLVFNLLLFARIALVLTISILLGMDVRRQVGVGALLPRQPRLPRPLLLLLPQRLARQQVWRSAHHSPQLQARHRDLVRRPVQGVLLHPRAARPLRGHGRYQRPAQDEGGEEVQELRLVHEGTGTIFMIFPVPMFIAF
jgi:hypothetical protein